MPATTSVYKFKSNLIEIYYTFQTVHVLIGYPIIIINYRPETTIFYCPQICRSERRKNDLHLPVLHPGNWNVPRRTIPVFIPIKTKRRGRHDRGRNPEGEENGHDPRLFRFRDVPQMVRF